ncbi:patatin-like phospholipase family protein [Aggregatilinea lenta]|uniref:patatin-like phospholipase family protein n=1 Tax=Aggregatilinea lenta TaxID=913108 RepID=UPI000E5BD9B0|nr:patatin-like phospholipase family protein [Aggregatilinea lenta]
MQPGSERQPMREHIGIAVDGGGVRGTIVAHGLIALEEMLGTRPLIDDPRVKVVAGTSTGSLIAAALALGMTGEEILDLYHTVGERAFSKPGPLRPVGKSLPLLGNVRLPNRVARLIERLPGGVGEFLAYLLMPARYSFDPLRQILHETLVGRPGIGWGPTLGEMGAALRAKPNAPTLIVTAVEVAARQTRFLKSTPGETYQHMKLIDALLASSSVPTYFPPIPLPPDDPAKKPNRWLVDGGVGNFGNPALVVAWELCDPRGTRRYDPADVSIISFGTGYVPPDVYRRTYGSAAKWWALDWAAHVTDLFIEDAIREQTRNIPAYYPGIDLRRYQVELDRVVRADDFELIDTVLDEKGRQMQDIVREDAHVLRTAPAVQRDDHDPERVLNAATARMIRRRPGQN